MRLDNSHNHSVFCHISPRGGCNILCTTGTQYTATTTGHKHQNKHAQKIRKSGVLQLFSHIPCGKFQPPCPLGTGVQLALSTCMCISNPCIGPMLLSHNAYFAPPMNWQTHLALNRCLSVGPPPQNDARHNATHLSALVSSYLMHVTL